MGLIKFDGVDAFFNDADKFRPSPVEGIGGDINKIAVFDGDDVGVVDEQTGFAQDLFDILTIVLEDSVVLEKAGGVTLDGD